MQKSPKDVCLRCNTLPDLSVFKNGFIFRLADLFSIVSIMLANY
jgi:hypothetical protein